MWCEVSGGGLDKTLLSLPAEQWFASRKGIYETECPIEAAIVHMGHPSKSMNERQSNLFRKRIWRYLLKEEWMEPGPLRRTMGHIAANAKMHSKEGGHLDTSNASQYLMGTLVASPVEEIHVAVWYQSCERSMWLVAMLQATNASSFKIGHRSEIS